MKNKIILISILTVFMLGMTSMVSATSSTDPVQDKLEDVKEKLVMKFSEGDNEFQTTFIAMIIGSIIAVIATLLGCTVVGLLF